MADPKKKASQVDTPQASEEAPRSEAPQSEAPKSEAPKSEATPVSPTQAAPAAAATATAKAPAPSDPNEALEAKTFDHGYVRDLRSENASYRTRAREAEERNAALAIQIELLNQQTQDAALKAAVAVAAGKLNIVDAEAALALMNREGIGIGEGGTIEGVDDALMQLIEDKPYLIADVGLTTPSGNPARINAQFTSKQLATMSPQEIIDAKLSDDDLSRILVGS